MPGAYIKRKLSQPRLYSYLTWVAIEYFGSISSFIQLGIAIFLNNSYFNRPQNSSKCLTFIDNVDFYRKHCVHKPIFYPPFQQHFKFYIIVGYSFTLFNDILFILACFPITYAILFCYSLFCII